VAQVGLDHARVARHLGRRALGDQLALRQHPDVRGEVHHRLHHVLDHQHGDAAGGDVAHHRHHLGHFLRVQAGQHFVEQQQARRVASARASSSRLRPATVRSPAGLVQLRRQADALGHESPPVPAPAPAGAMQVRADGDVLAHGLRREGLHDLEGARHAAARVQVRRLARDVGPSNSMRPRPGAGSPTSARTASSCRRRSARSAR
jgi:hypothetical protein